MPRLTTLALAVPLLAGSLGLGGCASKTYVNEQIAIVSHRVDALETRLNETDGTAKAARGEAQAASGQSQANAQRLDALNARVDRVEQKMAQQAALPVKRPRH